AASDGSKPHASIKVERLSGKDKNGKAGQTVAGVSLARELSTENMDELRDLKDGLSIGCSEEEKKQLFPNDMTVKDAEKQSGIALYKGEIVAFCGETESEAYTIVVRARQ